MCDPLVIHWPAGITGQGRGAPPVPPLHRHRPDDPRRLRRRDARRRQRREQTPLPGRVDALLVRRRRRADAEGDAVLRDARHRGHLARRLEGRHRARPDDRHWATSTTTAGSCSTPTRTAPRPTTSPTQHPEKLEELKALWIEEAEANNVLPLNDLQIIGNRRTSRRSSAGVPRAGAAERAVHVLPGHARDPGALGGQRARRVVQGPRRGRARRPTARA